MMIKLISTLTFIFCLTACSTKQEFNYPVTRTEPFDTTIFNVKISDPYFLMSRKANEKEMKEWVNAQGKLTQSILDSIPNGEKPAAEIEEGYIKMQDEIWDLEVVNNMFYYYRDIPEVGSSFCRRKTMDANCFWWIGRVEIPVSVLAKLLIHTNLCFGKQNPSTQSYFNGNPSGNG